MLNLCLRKGVTTAVWDPHELANVSGLEGMDYALLSAEEAPIRFLTLAPTCVPSAPGYEVAGADFDSDIIQDLLMRDDIHGSAELMTMQPLLSGNQRVIDIVNEALKSGKRVCGHGRGLEGRNLSAYAATGIQTDHELSSADDLIARLEAGMTVELRGSHEHLLPDFAKAILDLGHMPQTVTLCTDDVFADDLQERGALDRVMRQLIKQGLPPVWVYRAATLQAATQIGRTDLGHIAPGKRADIVLLSDLEDVRAQTVFKEGQLFDQNKDTITRSGSVAIPTPLAHSVNTKIFEASDFEIHAKGKKARIATLSKPRFPSWGERVVTIKNDTLHLPDDMIRLAVVNRHGENTPPRIAFLENWGDWRGTFATTVAHDSHNLSIFGKDPLDMALAANTLRKIGGGLVVVEQGEIVASLDLPIAGLISDQALETVAKDLGSVRSALDKLVTWQPPYLVFKALFGASLVCNIGPRLSDVGLVDPFEGKVLQSCILEIDPD